MTKVACNKKGINSFDLVIFANLFSIVISGILACVTGKGFYVVKELRMPLFWRSVVGLIGLISFTLSAALTSITIQLTVGNLAPFIAGLIAYCTIGERMTSFEIISMFVSFGAIILIGIA